MPFIDQIEISGKKVLARLDFNVPLDKGVIQDESRILAALPTLRYILDNGGILIACSHLGKPKGEAKSELSLQPVAESLSKHLGQEVPLASDCIGDAVKAQVENLEPGQAILLENLRFHKGETDNDPEFSAKLAELADVYVNDAFGVVHRAHASVVGITEHIDTCSAGFLIKKEMEYLQKALQEPARPFVLISGGAKVSSKLGILSNLLNKVDRIIIGGAMANTFRKAQGYAVGNSFTEDDLLQTANDLLQRAKENKIGLYLPVDYVLGKDIQAKQPLGVYPFQGVPQEGMILDTGPASHVLFSEVIKDARTIVWNGPMGAFENPTFSQGSVGLAQSIAKLDVTSILGGGDTDSLIHKCQLQDKVSFISTGGGSFLEFLEGKELPGLKALNL